MISSILREYGIQLHQCKVDILVSGLINSTWKVSDAKQSYILQRINNNVFTKPHDIAQNIRLIDLYLKQNHPQYFFISSIKTLQGKEMVHDPEKGYFRLFPYVNGSHTINVVASSDQAYEAAFQFGKFTHLLEDFEASKLHVTIPDFHNVSLRYRQFEAALSSGNAVRIQHSEELIIKLKQYHHIIETFEKIGTIPSVRKRVMHHDTKISNVLFDQHGKGMAIIDLDTVMSGYFISDVGDMMRTYLSPANEEEQDFSKIEVRTDYFHAIVNGYLECMHQDLTKEEQGLILYSGLFLVYMQALRFLTDYCNNDVYYGAQYEDQNFVRAGNQISLLQHLEKRAPELEKIVLKELTKKFY